MAQMLNWLQAFALLIFFIALKDQREKTFYLPHSKKQVIYVENKGIQEH